MSYVKSLAKGFKNAPVMTTVGLGFSILDPVLEVKSEIDKGKSAPVAIAKGGARWAAMELVPGLGAGMMLKAGIDAGFIATKAIGDHNARLLSPLYKANFGGNFIDTQNAYTMRQRGLNAMKNNGISNSNTLGNEARMYTRGRYE